VNHVLLDTQLLLWAAAADEKLPDAVIKRLDDQHTQPLFSAASIWEIVIKTGLGREDFNVDAAVLRRGLIDNGYRELPITSAHTLAVGRLPDLHRNPFDRILAAQANEEGIELLTADRTLAQYPGSITLVEAQHRGAGG
jgi:PIN domain nuclease of toxin-antitoxin system